VSSTANHDAGKGQCGTSLAILDRRHNPAAAVAKLDTACANGTRPSGVAIAP
jgi:hypothetical protein